MHIRPHPGRLILGERLRSMVYNTRATLLTSKIAAVFSAQRDIDYSVFYGATAELCSSRLTLLLLQYFFVVF